MKIIDTIETLVRTYTKEKYSSENLEKVLRLIDYKIGNGEIYYLNNISSYDFMYFYIGKTENSRSYLFKLSEEDMEDRSHIKESMLYNKIPWLMYKYNNFCTAKKFMDNGLSTDLYSYYSNIKLLKGASVTRIPYEDYSGELINEKQGNRNEALGIFYKSFVIIKFSVYRLHLTKKKFEDFYFFKIYDIKEKETKFWFLSKEVFLRDYEFSF